MKSVSELLKGLKQGTGKITFFTPMTDRGKVAKIALPNGYHLTAGLKAKLQEITNIIRVD
jgi:hypothetical protein